MKMSGNAYRMLRSEPFTGGQAGLTVAPSILNGRASSHVSGLAYSTIPASSSSSSGPSYSRSLFRNSRQQAQLADTQLIFSSYVSDFSLIMSKDHYLMGETVYGIARFTLAEPLLIKKISLLVQGISAVTLGVMSVYAAGINSSWINDLSSHRNLADNIRVVNKRRRKLCNESIELFKAPSALDSHQSLVLFKDCTTYYYHFQFSLSPDPIPTTRRPASTAAVLPGSFYYLGYNQEYGEVIEGMNNYTMSLVVETVDTGILTSLPKDLIVHQDGSLIPSVDDQCSSEREIHQPLQGPSSVTRTILYGSDARQPITSFDIPCSFAVLFEKPWKSWLLSSSAPYCVQLFLERDRYNTGEKIKLHLVIRDKFTGSLAIRRTKKLISVKLQRKLKMFCQGLDFKERQNIACKKNIRLINSPRALVSPSASETTVNSGQADSESSILMHLNYSESADVELEIPKFTPNTNFSLVSNIGRPWDPSPDAKDIPTGKSLGGSTDPAAGIQCLFFLKVKLVEYKALFKKRPTLRLKIPIWIGLPPLTSQSWQYQTCANELPPSY